MARRARIEPSDERLAAPGPVGTGRSPWKRQPDRLAWRRMAIAMFASFMATLAMVALTAPAAGAAVFADPFRGSGIAPISVLALVIACVAAAASALAVPLSERGGALFVGGGVLVAIAASWIVTDSGRRDMLQALLIVAGTAAVSMLTRRLARGLAPVGPERLLVLGSGEVAARLVETLRRTGGAFQVVGFADDRPEPHAGLRVRYLGSIADIGPIARTYGIDRVVVAFSQRPDSEIVAAIRRIDDAGVAVSVVPRMFDLLPPGAEIRPLGAVNAVDVKPIAKGRLGAMFKRGTDIVGSLALLILFSPLIALAAVAVMIEDGRPVIFRQERIGAGGRPFRVLKFRSMVKDADRIGNERIADLFTGEIGIDEAATLLKDADDPRITRVGRLLRKTSLDELPQLVNVLRGEMSLVGPRPLRDFEVDSLEGWQRRRIMARPGMTGLWQVSGRSDVSWDERMQLDYQYVRHWSLGEDLRILARTIPAVLARRGAH